MIKSLIEFKTNLFEKYIFENHKDDKDILDVLNKVLCRPELLFIHKNKKRQLRNDFLNKLKFLLISRQDIVSFISDKYNVLNFAEHLFDEISQCIEVCEISKANIDIQIWSNFKRVDIQCNRIRYDVEKLLDKKPKKKISTQFIELENDDGILYSPDAAIENQILYLSLALKLLAYKFDLFEGDDIVIPSEIEVSDLDVNHAGSIELLARSWKELEDIANRCLLFGGKAYCSKGDDCKEEGIDSHFYFTRNESTFEKADAISCERIKKKSFQGIIDILSCPETKSLISSDFKSVGGLGDRSFISEDEVLTCRILEDVFCTNVFEDEAEYNGLTLRDWIRGYFSLKYFSERVTQKIIEPILNKKEILDTLVDSGLLLEKSNIFLELVTFGKNSRDLYDCPLVKIKDDTYHLSYYGLINANVSNLILSRFSSLDVDTSKKGYGFESNTIEMISNSLSECKSFKFKRGLDEYEYDAVFVLDNKVFVLECKNRSLSWFNPVKIYRNEKYLYEVVDQLIRLKNALIKYPEVLKEQFNLNVDNYEIVPVIFNCMPFSWLGEFKGVYISDFSSFSRFVKSPNIHLIFSDAQGQRIKMNSKLRQWTGSKPNSIDLIHHLEKPIQLIPYIKSRKSIFSTWPASDDVCFSFVDYHTDIKKYAKEEIKLFSTPIKFTKVIKKTKSRRDISRESRKTNRRR